MALNPSSPQAAKSSPQAAPRQPPGSPQAAPTQPPGSPHPTPMQPDHPCGWPSDCHSRRAQGRLETELHTERAARREADAALEAMRSELDATRAQAVLRHEQDSNLPFLRVVLLALLEGRSEADEASLLQVCRAPPRRRAATSPRPPSHLPATLRWRLARSRANLAALAPRTLEVHLALCNGVVPPALTVRPAGRLLALPM